jgi:lipoic acid synthetase
MTTEAIHSHRQDGGLVKPAWIRVRIGEKAAHAETLARLRAHRLHTVCEEALCPNRSVCWAHGRATILILGDRCTRRCRFCNVEKRAVQAPDPDEPARVAAAVRESGLREVVLTSVTRDDLPDGGAALWAETIRRVHGDWPGEPAARSGILVEVLVPDFGGDRAAWQVVADARPDVFGHNLETVPRLYPQVRPEADYRRSLDLLRFAADAGLIAKTSLMLGMGETREEVGQVLRDARAAGARILYAGQYLQPGSAHLPVARYLPPREFDEIGALARGLGFDFVASAPLVRSSFHEEGQSVLVRKALTARTT